LEPGKCMTMASFREHSMFKTPVGEKNKKMKDAEAASNWVFQSLPDIQAVSKVCCIEITQYDSKVHLSNPNKDWHFHLQRVEKRQLTAAAMPYRIYTKWVSGARFYQTNCGSIPEKQVCMGLWCENWKSTVNEDFIACKFKSNTCKRDHGMHMLMEQIVRRGLRRIRYK